MLLGDYFCAGYDTEKLQFSWAASWSVTDVPQPIEEKSLLKMASTQLRESSWERAITNNGTVKEKVWGFHLMAPVRAPMRVFNKTSSEARVTIPKLSPSAYSCDKIPFFLNLKAG